MHDGEGPEVVVEGGVHYSVEGTGGSRERAALPLPVRAPGRGEMPAPHREVRREEECTVGLQGAAVLHLAQRQPSQPDANGMENTPVVEGSTQSDPTDTRPARPGSGKTGGSKEKGKGSGRPNGPSSSGGSMASANQGGERGYNRTAMDDHLKNCGEVPLLDADQERELSQIIEKGVEARERIANGEGTAADRRAARKGAQAKERFILANLRLVVSIARKYPLPPSMELMDLVQEGNLGLEHAVDKFDWRKGFKFSTYATFWIRQAIGRALDQKASLVRLPGDRSASLRGALRAVHGDGDQLEGEHAVWHRLTTPVHLDKEYDHDDGEDSTLHAVIPDASDGPDVEALENISDVKVRVRGLLDILDPRAKYAVEQRHGLNDGRKRSYREVGEELGVTAEAARRLVKRAEAIVRDRAGDVADFTN